MSAKERHTTQERKREREAVRIRGTGRDTWETRRHSARGRQRGEAARGGGGKLMAKKKRMARRRCAKKKIDTETQ